jgi:hypothetical protein
VARLPALWEIDPIKYLVQEKYPDLGAFASPKSRAWSLALEERYQKAESGAAAFGAELRKRSTAKIAKLVEQARSRETEKKTK